MIIIEVIFRYKDKPNRVVLTSVKQRSDVLNELIEMVSEQMQIDDEKSFNKIDITYQPETLRYTVRIEEKGYPHYSPSHWTMEYLDIEEEKWTGAGWDENMTLEDLLKKYVEQIERIEL